MHFLQVSLKSGGSDFHRGLLRVDRSALRVYDYRMARKKGEKGTLVGLAVAASNAEGYARLCSVCYLAVAECRKCNRGVSLKEKRSTMGDLVGPTLNDLEGDFSNGRLAVDCLGPADGGRSARIGEVTVFQEVAHGLAGSDDGVGYACLGSDAEGYCAATRCGYAGRSVVNIEVCSLVSGL